MSEHRRNLFLLMAAAAALGVTMGMTETSFNNFLNDTYQITADTRGFLEFPRELPGFLTAISAGVLAALANSRAGAVAMGLVAIGLFGLGHMAPDISIMVVWMMVWSLGQHLFMPLEQSLAISIADEGAEGRRLGQLAGFKTAAVILGAGFVWITTDYLPITYNGIFTAAAVTTLIAGFLLFKMRDIPQKRTSLRSRFALRREYSIYYWMSVLFGARKQVFLTFAPWVLVKVIGEPPSTIAKLWILSSLLGIVFKPLLGRLIDRWGERTVLMADAMVLTLVCLGYGYGLGLGWGLWGVRLAYACFVVDQMLFAVGMARTVYLKKIITDPTSLTPTLSMGVSIDHAVSMTIPLIGGLVWMRWGFPAVFTGAAVVSLVNLAVCSRAKTTPSISVGKPQTAEA